MLPNQAEEHNIYIYIIMICFDITNRFICTIYHECMYIRIGQTLWFGSAPDRFEEVPLPRMFVHHSCSIVSKLSFNSNDDHVSHVLKVCAACVSLLM